MSLDGLRAWIGEVERKLGMRTRVFLVLTVIAIGIGGAAIYLAIDARESSVSEGDVQALQEQLEAQIGTGSVGGGGAAGTEVAQLEAELKALQAEVAKLRSEGGKPQKGKGTSSGAGANESGGGTSSGLPNGTAGGATGGAASAAELEELLPQAKEQTKEAE
jgi:hypothetical protein